MQEREKRVVPEVQYAKKGTSLCSLLSGLLSRWSILLRVTDFAGLSTDGDLALHSSLGQSQGSRPIGCNFGYLGG
jgi:hypothetical protein